MKIIEATIPPLAMIILITIFLSIINLALSLPVFDFKNLADFQGYFTNIELFKLNFYPILIIGIALYLIINSIWISVLLLSVGFIGLGLLNKFKIQYLDSPLILADLKYLKELLNDLIDRGASISKEIYLIIGFILVLLLFLKLFFDFKIKNKKLRFTYIVILLVSSISIFNKYKIDDSELLDLTLKENKEYYVENGFIKSFIKDIERRKLLNVKKYDEENGEKILSKYKDYGLENDINIISVMVDEYYDFNKFDNIDFDKNIYKNYSILKNKSISGNLIVNEGLSRTEEEYLTGYINNVDFDVKTNSNVWYFKNNNLKTEYMTNRNLKDFNRLSKNNNLGFDTSTSINKTNFSKEIIEGYNKSKKKNKAYFNFTKIDLRDKSKSKNNYIQDGRLNKEENILLNNYFSNLSNVDENILELVEFFDEEEKPTIIIFMSSGSPKLGKNQEIYKKLNINMNIDSREGFMNKNSVPYIVWGNESIKNLYNKSFVKNGDILSPNYLLADIIDYLDHRGSGYIQYMNDKKEKASVINRVYFKTKNEFISTEKLPDYLKDMYKEYGDVEYFYQNNFKKDTIKK